MRYLLILLVVSTVYSCTNSNTEAPTNTTIAVTTKDTVTPEPKANILKEGCNFSMEQIKYASKIEFIAVSGIKYCVEAPFAMREVTLYKKTEAISNKTANIYSSEDTASHLSIGWSGDTLIVRHLTATALQSPEVIEVDGVLAKISIGQKGL